VDGLSGRSKQNVVVTFPVERSHFSELRTMDGAPATAGRLCRGYSARALVQRECIMVVCIVAWARGWKRRRKTTRHCFPLCTGSRRQWLHVRTGTAL